MLGFDDNIDNHESSRTSRKNLRRMINCVIDRF